MVFDNRFRAALRRLLVGSLLAVLAACASPAGERAAGVAATAPAASLPALPPTAAPTQAPTLPPPTAAPSPLPTRTPVPPTATPLPPTATPAPSPTPDPVAGLSIPELRDGRYGGGAIAIGEVYRQAPGYTTYRISYPAGDLRLTGLLHVPAGEGPFPVIIANRGYIAPERYQPGMDSRAFSDLLARAGYLVVAPDYRGYGGGDSAPNPFYTGYIVDTLHLIPLAQALPMARPGKVGMWGHSRGASITVAALTLSDQIAAAVVYAPAPADLAEDYERRRRQSGGDPGDDTWPFPPAENPDAYARVSPLFFLDAVAAPVQLHHGTADTVVEPSASVAIAEALRRAGRPVELYLYEGQGHALSGWAEAQYAERVLAFFAAHLPR